MKHVSLDAQNESIKQFVRDLSADSRVTILELNGQPVVCVLPIARRSNEPRSADDWTDEKHVRRCLLVDGEIAGTSSSAEAAELVVRLQRDMLRHQRDIIADRADKSEAPHESAVYDQRTAT